METVDRAQVRVILASIRGSSDQASVFSALARYADLSNETDRARQECLRVIERVVDPTEFVRINRLVAEHKANVVCVETLLTTKPPYKGDPTPGGVR